MKAILGLLLSSCFVAAACGSGDEKRAQDRDGAGADSGGAAGSGDSRNSAGEAGEAPEARAGAGGDSSAAAGAGGAGAVTSAGAGGDPAAAGAGGAPPVDPGTGMGGDGSQQVEEGVPGTVGNPCTAQGACENDLVCAASKYCQPGISSLPEAIVQAVPTPDSAQIPASAPIVLFADNTYTGVMFKIEAFGVSGSVDITADFSVVTLLSASGKDVYVLAAKSGLPLGQSVVVTLSGPIEGSVVFNVDRTSPPYGEAALDFETPANPANSCVNDIDATSLPIGWTGFGDVGAIPATGSLLPTSGSRMLAMSTGSALCGTALEETSSMVVSGPIRGLGESPQLGFEYNLQSSEFDDYCDTEFDDTLIAVLSGPKGAVATVIDSVNLVCARNTHAVGTFPGMPDDGDAIYKETGNSPFSLKGDVGSPAVLAFVLTDVGDDAYSSLISLDNIHVP